MLRQAVEHIDDYDVKIELKHYLQSINEVMTYRVKIMLLSIAENEFNLALNEKPEVGKNESEILLGFYSQVNHIRRVLNLRGGMSDQQGSGSFASHPLRSPLEITIEQGMGALGEELKKVINKSRGSKWPTPMP